MRTRLVRRLGITIRAPARVGERAKFVAKIDASRSASPGALPYRGRRRRLDEVVIARPSARRLTHHDARLTDAVAQG